VNQPLPMMRLVAMLIAESQALACSVGHPLDLIDK
jgi:hypothetical protein